MNTKYPTDQSQKKFPYFLGPDQHRLFEYYNVVNRIGFATMLALFGINEFFLRNNLPIYKGSTEKFWSKFVLVINAEIAPVAEGWFYIAIVLIPLAYLFILLLQPKWGERPSVRGLRKMVPYQIKYNEIHFYFESYFQRIGYYLWHYIFMMFSLLAVVITPVVLINLIRSL
jgi:hypothetical protein